MTTIEQFKRLQIYPTIGENKVKDIEVREDEDQLKKCQEIIDILVAAGYFRARIKGLSSFDKIVGGMTWCIQSCNVDLDVDLLFHENSSIGQKIALTEKIVSVLPKMKCPDHIEPHQIQGLDYVHIFPVVQWLVKKSLEFREEMSAFVQKFSKNRFEKEFDRFENTTTKSNKTLSYIEHVDSVYKPHRYYRRTCPAPTELSTKILMTLLEYGHSGNISQDKSNQNATTEKDLEEDISINENLTQEDLERLNTHYNSLQIEFKSKSSDTEEKSSSIESQLETLTEKYHKLKSENQKLKEKIDEENNKIGAIIPKQQSAKMELNHLMEQVNDISNSKNVKELALINGALKDQQIQFKQYCENEYINLQRLLDENKKKKPSQEENSEIDKAIDEETEKLKILRLKLAKKYRLIAALERQFDQIPNRMELAQYQRRFFELYNQVAAKHKETKQYYTLYNTLDDTRVYMEKELSLLNSISDNYPEAIQSESGKVEFLNQFQNILEGVKQNKRKIEMKLNDEKKRREEASNVLQGLFELQRKYVNVVRQLNIECKKHETIINQN